MITIWNSPTLMHNDRKRVRVRYYDVKSFPPGAGWASEIATASNPNDRLMFRLNLAWSVSNPATALLIQVTSTFRLSASSSRCNAGFLKAFFEEEQDRSSRSVSRL